MTDSELPFPKIKLKGNPAEIGWQCGRLLEEQIKTAVEFYRGFIFDQFVRGPTGKVAVAQFGSDGGRSVINRHIETLTERYIEIIRENLPAHAEEIEAIAAAVKLPLTDIYMINCRSELVCQAISEQSVKPPADSLAGKHECTAVLVPEKRLLAQTWDWHPKTEDILTLIEIEPKHGERILMLAESGIIGKFGINSSGLGLMLTILFAPVANIGIPVHLLLRRILESSSTAGAMAAITALPRGSTASLTFCDRSGDWRMLELAGQEIIEIKDDGTGLVHSNHYLSEKDPQESALPASHTRVTKAKSLYRQAAEAGIPGLMNLLSNRDGGAESICRAYGQGKLFEVGTVAALVLDPSQQTMYVARGQPNTESDWHPVTLE